MPTIRYADVPVILACLSALDGRPEVVEVSTDDGKTKKMIQTTPYSFSGKVRLAIARWHMELNKHNEARQKAEEGLAKQLGLGTPTAVATVKGDEIPTARASFEVQVRELRETAVTIDLPLIAYDELKPEDNRLPPSVLGGLGVVLAV